MTTYKSKTTGYEVEAIQFTAENLQDIKDIVSAENQNNKTNVIKDENCHDSNNINLKSNGQSNGLRSYFDNNVFLNMGKNKITPETGDYLVTFNEKARGCKCLNYLVNTKEKFEASYELA